MNKVYASHFEFGNTPARATIEVAGLPGGGNIEFTGVAVTDLSNARRFAPRTWSPARPQVPASLPVTLSTAPPKSGFIPGVNGGIYASTVETQLRQTMRNLLDGLEEAGMNFSNVVAANVYLDNTDDFSRMNGVYAQYFGTRAAGPYHHPADCVRRKSGRRERPMANTRADFAHCREIIAALRTAINDCECGPIRSAIFRAPYLLSLATSPPLRPVMLRHVCSLGVRNQ